VGIRLITRRGNDWTTRYPLVVEAVNHLKVRFCLIDGEVACCDENGLAAFQLLRHRRNEPKAFLYAIDRLELNGTGKRREPIEVAREAKRIGLDKLEWRPAQSRPVFTIESDPQRSWPQPLRGPPIGSSG
jgi:hypothetical protein